MAIELDLHYSTIYRYMKKNGLKHSFRIDKTCVNCNQKFSAKTKLAKYCSRKCKFSVISKSDKWKINQHRYNTKKPLLCLGCKAIIDVSKRTGIRYCTTQCKQNHRKPKESRGFTKRLTHAIFELYKMNLGCNICNYNKSGSSLDFHHINNETKLGRIESTDFWNLTEYFKNEIIKCVLLCKNCHHEVHELKRRSIAEYFIKMNNIQLINYYDIAENLVNKHKKKTQCNANTQNGVKCRNTTKSSNGLCRQLHGGSLQLLDKL